MNSASTKSALEHSIEARKARWLNFMSPKAAPGFLFVVRFEDPEDQRPSAPPLWPSHKDQRVERIWEDYERALLRAEWLHDDYVPHLSMLTGTEIFAEAFGCAVHRPEVGMPCAKPLIQEAGEVAGVSVPELSSSSLAYLFEMADRLQQRAGPEAIFRMVDVQSPMDIAALIWNKEKFLLALLEEPEAVKELARKTRALLIAFFDQWFGRYGTEFIAHYPEYFMSGGLTLSEDEIGAVNRDMFIEFFLPELVHLSERYGGLGMHCCADSRHQWSHFKEIPGLRLLNLCKPPNRGSEFIEDALTHFSQECVQWPVGWEPKGEVEDWPDQIPQDARVVFDVWVGSPEEARRVADRLNEIRAGSLGFKL